MASYKRGLGVTPGYRSVRHRVNIYDTEVIHAATKKAESENEEKEQSVEDIFNTLTEEQKDAVYTVIAAVLEKYGVKLGEDEDEKSE